MEFIDTHCHLHFENYDADRDKVLGDAGQTGVTKVICVGCSLADSARAIEFAASHENVWATAGAHPHDGGDFSDNINDSVNKLKELVAKPKIVAVGEIGLDYYHNRTPRDVQEKILRAQIEVGLENNLPFVFHIREAWDDFWPILDSYQGIRGVIHSFSAPPNQLNEVLRRGLYIGLNGLITYTKEDSWLEAAREVPLDRLLLETDAPFLTPKPFRGTRCEPKHVATVAEFLATLRSQPLEQLAAASTTNAVTLFNLGGR